MTESFFNGDKKTTLENTMTDHINITHKQQKESDQ